MSAPLAPPTLDHLIVFARPGAPEADALVAAGLAEGAANVHPGQGTANRRFFFGGGYLECLFVTDADEARTAPGDRLRFVDRVPGAVPGACPFGLAVRTEGPPPFETWRYAPAFAPSGLPVATDSDDSRRVLVFATTFPRRELATEHRLVSVTIEGPAADAGAFGTLDAPGLVRRVAPEWRMTLALAGPGRGDVLLAPLKLRVRW